MSHLSYVSERNKINLNSTAARIECVDPVTFITANAIYCLQTITITAFLYTMAVQCEKYFIAFPMKCIQVVEWYYIKLTYQYLRRKDFSISQSSTMFLQKVERTRKRQKSFYRFTFGMRIIHHDYFAVIFTFPCVYNFVSFVMCLRP